LENSSSSQTDPNAYHFFSEVEGHFLGAKNPVRKAGMYFPQEPPFWEAATLAAASPPSNLQREALFWQRCLKVRHSVSKQVALWMIKHVGDCGQMDGL